MFTTLLRRVAVGAFLCHAAFPQSAFAKAQIPDQFRGVWQPTVEGKAPTCLENDADIRQTVLADRIDFHEGRCTVRSVKSVGKDGLQLRASCRAEDRAWTTRQNWTLVEAKGMRQLKIRNLDRSNPTVVFGLCPARAAESLSDSRATSGPTEGLCYSDSASTLEIWPDGKGKARISIDSVQGNAHMCSLEGNASRTDAGYLYSTRLDDGTQCNLEIMLDAKHGGVTFKDPDWTCKQYHCGARASFEHIEFRAAAKTPCRRSR